VMFAMIAGGMSVGAVTFALAALRGDRHDARALAETA
jgi:hypothetical protein